MAHLNAAGITRLVTKLKDRFAALAHTHAAATDITGQLPVANGGTGASTASGARTNLDAAQDNSSGITLADAGSNISTLLATTGIASTPSGETLQGQISTLQDYVSSVNTGGPACFPVVTLSGDRYKPSILSNYATIEAALPDKSCIVNFVTGAVFVGIYLYANASYQSLLFFNYGSMEIYHARKNSGTWTINKLAYST